jgi:TPR repeat protein
VGIIRLLIVFITAILLSVGAASAGDYDEGATAYNHGDFATAKRLWLPLAEQGDAKAQTGLAIMYFLGQGVTMNLAAAMDWSQKAAEQGSPVAQYLLGQIYQHPWDPEVRDLNAAFKWYSKAADQGYADAQDELGGMYELGLGVPRDYAKAEQWFAKAGDLRAIARMYDDVVHDHPLAATWYRKMADQGDPYAMFRLGEMYRDGVGVSRDYVSAQMWFNLADKAGYHSASAVRNDLTQKMTADQIARMQRLAQEWRPVK